MKKSLVLAASLALVLGACGPDHKPAVPTAAASQLVAPAPAPAPVPPTATDAKPPEPQK